MPTDTVEHLVSTGGYVPPTERNRRNAKALDSGFRQEDRMVRVAWQAHGEGVCWRSPGISSLRRNTGDGYLPDAAGRLPELDRIVGVRAADTPGRQDYNWLLSVKSQNCHGSARQKIFVEIEDLAGVCDTTGLVAAVVLQGAHIDRRYVAALKRKGHIHMVVVLTEDELARGELAPALVSMARQREIFARKLGPRGGLARRWWTTERAFAYLDRRGVRRTTARVTRGMLVPA